MKQVKPEINNTGHPYNLFYGLLENELKHISEVKNGLKCNCICPACEKKLVARNGGLKRIHHFAHYQSAECRYGVQTSIHIAAKNILERVKKIRIPEVTVIVNTEVKFVVNTDVEFMDPKFFISNELPEKISDAKYIVFDEVILEKKYIPDVVLIVKGKKLIVEIAVTHFVGRDKLEKIKDSKTSAIEIDLSKIRNDFNLGELEQLIVHNLEIKKWLFNQYGKEYVEKKELELWREIDELKEVERLYIEKRKEKEKLEQKEHEPEKQRIDKFWKDNGYYKEIVYKQVSNGHIIKQIKDCPLKRHEKEEYSHARVYSDCQECKNYRNEREGGKYLVCIKK